MLWRATVRSDAVRIDPTRCVRSRLDRALCRACADACPENAIVLDRLPALAAERCTGCRRCEAACPAGAIEGDARDLIALATELAKVPQPVLGCRVPQVDAHVRTGCLGFLEREALAALALALPEGVTLNLTGCADCPNAAAVAGLAACAEEVRRLLGGAAGSLHVATTRAALAFRPQALSRRAFFATAVQRCAAAVAPPPAASREEPHGERKHLPARRRLLLANLPRAPSRKPIENALLPALEFRATCNNCMACVGMCPTGAIGASRADPPRPRFDAARCTRCGICAEFCAPGAIALPAGGAAAPAAIS